MLKDPAVVEKTLTGVKTWETRSSSCKCHKSGVRFYIALSGGGGICGSVEFDKSIGPLTSEQWEANRHLHHVAGPKPKKPTHAWVTTNPVKFSAPVPYKPKRGCVVWSRTQQPKSATVESVESKVCDLSLACVCVFCFLFFLVLL